MGQGSTPNLPLTGQPGKLSADEYAGGSVPNVVTFGFRDITPPSDVYIQVTDTMVLLGNTTLAGGDTLTLSIRLLLPFPPSPGQPGDTIDAEIIAAGSAGKATPAQVRIATQREYYTEKVGPGYIQVLTAQLPIPTAGASVSLKIPLAEGYLLSAAILSANATAFGQTYATLYIGRGTPIAGLPPAALLLIADYPTNLIPVGWPPIPIRQTAGGQANLSTFSHANLTGTGGIIFTGVPGLRQQILSVEFRYIANATVATRSVALQFTDSSGNSFATMGLPATITASQQPLITFGIGLQPVNDANFALMNGSLPDDFILNNGTVGIVTQNGQAGDSITVIQGQLAASIL